MNRKDINVPEAQAPVLPDLFREPERVVRPKIFELIGQPDNIDEVITYLETYPNHKLTEYVQIADNDIETDSFTPYMYALYHERFDILREMIQAMSREGGLTIVNLLFRAIILRHHIHEIELLIDFGADIFSPISDSSQFNIIDFIFTMNRVDVIDYCIQTKRFDLHKDLIRHPFRLHQACAHGADLIVERLLLCGADPHAVISSKSIPGAMQELSRMVTPSEVLQSGYVSPLKISSLMERLNLVAQQLTSVSTCQLKSNMARTIMLMLDKNADVNVKNNFDENLFHLLAIHGFDLATGERLRAAGIEINQASVDGQTPLHLAAMAGQASSIKTLIALGANSKLKDKRGHYPVIYSKDVDTGKLLLSYLDAEDKRVISEIMNAKISVPREIWSLCDEKIVDELVETIIVSVKENDPMVVLKYLYENPRLESLLSKMKFDIILKLFKYAKSDPYILKLFLSVDSGSNLAENHFYMHMLKSALMFNHRIDVIELLLNTADSTTLSSEYPDNPVFTACQFGRLDALHALESRGVDIHQKTMEGYTTLHAACDGVCGEGSSSDVALYLIEKGAQTDATFHDGDGGVISVIDMLVPRREEDINELNYSAFFSLKTMTHPLKILKALKFDFYKDYFLVRCLPSMILILSTDDDFNDLLIEYIRQCDQVFSKVSGDLLKNSSDQSTIESSNIQDIKIRLLSLALVFASLYGAIRNVRSLLSGGAEIDYAEPKFGTTALHCAVLYKRERLINLLLKAGADPTLITRAGNTPLKLAYHGSAKQNAAAYLKSLLTIPLPVAMTAEDSEQILLSSSTAVVDPDLMLPVPLEQLPISLTEGWRLTLAEDDLSQPVVLNEFESPIFLREWPNVATNLVNVLRHSSRSSIQVFQAFSEGYYFPGQLFKVLPLRDFSVPSQAFSYEALVCLEARDIAYSLENLNPCRVALIDLSSNGFRGMKTLKLDEHFATPGLKLLYDHRDQNTPVGVFVRCNLLTIQRARKEILYKALIAHSLFRVCPSANMVNGLCSIITHDDIPQNDEQSSALMKMLPGTSGAKKQSGPKT